MRSTYPVTRRAWTIYGYVTLAVLCLALRLPRLEGPVDLRFDAGVYYVLGTSLAEGKGYRLLSEPGEIQSVQYPPLLPAIIAAHQLVLGSTDPDTVGHVLRLTASLVFVAYVLAVFWMAAAYLPTGLSFIAALIVALHFWTHFYAEYLIAELPFALVAALFFGIVGREEVGRSRAGTEPAGGRAVFPGLLAVAGFYLRTVGIALLGTWVADSLIRRRFRETAIRAAIAMLCVLAWHGYVSAVKRGPEYAKPAYAYQRAPYMMYNVSYSENFWLIEPRRPEVGRISVLDLPGRVISHLGEVGIAAGESISIARGWWTGEVRKANQLLGRQLIPLWTGDAALMTLTILIAGGLVVLLWRRLWLIPIYMTMSILLFAAGPWPGSLKRYTGSLAAFSAVALLTVIQWIWRRAGRLRVTPRRIARFAAVAIVLVILAQEVHTLRKSFRMLYYPALWVDEAGRQGSYPLLAYNPPWRLYDEALAWLRRNAQPGEIIATSSPHWAYLKTGHQTVLPPWEPDPGAAQRLLEAVPVEYLVIDNVLANENAEVARRYSLPVVRAFPDKWKLVHATGDSGASVYRKLEAAAGPPGGEQP